MPCRSIKILSLVFLAVSTSSIAAPALAANGIDTASGVNNLPVNVEGVMGMTLYNTTNSSSGPVYVGIGTTVPYAPFTIHTGTNQNLAVEPGSGWGVSGIALQSFNDGASLAEPLLLQGSTLYLQATGGDISIGTSTSPSATISITGNMNVTGNVGIGSAAPIGNLDVENGSNAATLCLNGQCVTSLSASGSVVTQYDGLYGGSLGTHEFCAVAGEACGSDCNVGVSITGGSPGAYTWSVYNQHGTGGFNVFCLN